MDKKHPGMPFLSSIGFSITTKCPVTCPHCIVEAGPYRTDEMSCADAEKWIHESAEYRNGYIRSIVFTGGEPFLDRQRLERLLTCAESCRLVPAIVTNAFWAGSISDARVALSRLPQIRMLVISTDQFHQRSIPLSHVKNAVQAAEELGLKYNIATTFVDEHDLRYREIIGNLKTIVDPSLIRESAVFPAGRAAVTIKPDTYVTTKEYPAGPCTGADFPTVFPDGRIIGCMGMLADVPTDHPLLFGNLREDRLARILDKAETNIALHILRIWGPARLLEILDEKGVRVSLAGPFLKNGYCTLCHVLLVDKQLRNGVRTLAKDPELVKMVSYARVYFLNEPAMVDAMSR